MGSAFDRRGIEIMNIKLLALSMIALSGPALAEVEIDQPKGGWRKSGAGERFTQEVHYPAASVNTPEGTSTAAMIRGRISDYQKSKASETPATLIVNGTAMPLQVEQDGSFSRPYAFGQGSNSVEVRSPDGSSRKRVQFYDGASNKRQSRLRVVLSWDSPGTDLDLHVVTPTGEHAWYGERVIPSGGALDVDVTTGYGPEIFASPSPEKGSYLVYVNYYGAGYGVNDLTIAQVAIISNENTPNEKRQVFQVPMRRAGDLTLVSSFTYP
jgi:uncharacterized protein YfaP (DUF2135 family)